MTIAAQERAIARWAEKARQSTQRRDETIRGARAEGLSLRQIAEAAGLSHSAIAKILARPAR